MGRKLREAVLACRNEVCFNFGEFPDIMWFVLGSNMALLRFCVMYGNTFLHYDKWAPVTTVWRVLRLRMEERPPIWWVLSKQSRAADKGGLPSWGLS